MSDLFATLPPSAFWRPGVVENGPFGLAGLIQPKFPVTRESAVATAGSCFAQHVGRALRRAGIAVLDVEPAPRGLDAATAQAYGFGLYSGRYGNIYTARQLHQLLDDCGTETLRTEAVWQRDGRFFDALRPSVEPDGCASAAEVSALRRFHLGRLRGLFERTQLFVFTLGLTETWADAATGTVFPSAPGVIAEPPLGRDVRFHNLSYTEVLGDLAAARKLLRQFNPALRMILSVSPVPLTASVSGRHVLVANSASKAILRAAADEFSSTHPDVDYVPSYEIITHPAARGRFYADNLRSVTQAGVDLVMATFLQAHSLDTQPPQPSLGGEGSPQADDTTDPQAHDEALVCEEALVEAFLK